MVWVQAGDDGGYISGCLFPLSMVSGGAVCVLMFLLFPKTTLTDVPEDLNNGQFYVYSHVVKYI